jgi:hypothetical protein
LRFRVPETSPSNAAYSDSVSDKTVADVSKKSAMVLQQWVNPERFACTRIRKT